MKVLTTKDLHIAIKKSNGIEYLMSRFNFEGEEALFDAIRRITDNYSFFVKALKKKKKDLVEEKLKDVDVEPELELKNLKGEALPPEESSTMRLEKLQKKEAELSTSLCELESKHKELVASRREIVSIFESEKDKLVKLNQQIAVHKSRILELHEKYSQCAGEMEKLSEEIRVYAEQLVQIRGKVAELSRVSVFVYSSGELEIENAEMPEIPTEQLAQLFSSLIALPEAEAVTVGGVRSIAKLWALRESFPDMEVVFELEAMRTLYEKED